MAHRTIKEIVTGYKSVDGAGVHLVRVLGSLTVKNFDPFLMLDAFDSRNPEEYIKGFPLHPHRGIETFTYLIQGDVEHKDSLGNQGRILNGCCQWMTAGGGILHQEMPKATERLLGLQLWINLPQKYKMVDPKYRDITAEMIPKVEEDSGIIAVVTGRYKDTFGATEGEYVNVNFFDLILKPDKVWQVATDPEHTVFAYIVEGACGFESALIPAKHATLFTSGEDLFIQTGSDGARVILVSGKPIQEPIAWGGPIVMNTNDELQEAFIELESGTFIKHG